MTGARHCAGTELPDRVAESERQSPDLGAYLPLLALCTRLTKSTVQHRRRKLSEMRGGISAQSERSWRRIIRLFTSQVASAGGSARHSPRRQTVVGAAELGRGRAARGGGARRLECVFAQSPQLRQFVRDEVIAHALVAACRVNTQLLAGKLRLRDITVGVRDFE